MSTVTEEALIAGFPDEVWALVTEPVYVQKWYAFGGASIDLRPGGTITMRWDEHGEFQAIVDAVTRAQLLAFHWIPQPSSCVTITLGAVAPNHTRVQIVESGDLDDPTQTALAWRIGLRILTELADERTTE